MSEQQQPESDILVCYRINDPRRKQGLSTEASTCSACGAAVGMTPVSARFAASNPDVKVICNVCFEPMQADEIHAVPRAK